MKGLWPIFKSKLLIYQSKAYLDLKIFLPEALIFWAKKMFVRGFVLK